MRQIPHHVNMIMCQNMTKLTWLPNQRWSTWWSWSLESRIRHTRNRGSHGGSLREPWCTAYSAQIMCKDWRRPLQHWWALLLSRPKFDTWNPSLGCALCQESAQIFWQVSNNPLNFGCCLLFDLRKRLWDCEEALGLVSWTSRSEPLQTKAIKGSLKRP